MPIPRMTNGRYIMGQFVRPAERKRAMLSLLSDAELPGDEWSVWATRLYRAGSRAEADPWPEMRRARKSGMVTGWRSFRRGQGGRSFWIQVTSLVSTDDAEAVLPRARYRMGATDGTALIDFRTISDQPVPGASASDQFEVIVAVGDEMPKVQRVIIATIDRFVVYLGASEPDVLAWPEIRHIIGLQLAKMPRGGLR